jgi:hypothetical protein
MGIQQALSGIEHALVVIDDGDNLFLDRESAGPAKLVLSHAL